MTVTEPESAAETLIRWGLPILEIIEKDDGSVLVYVGSEGLQQGLHYESLKQFHAVMIKHDRGWEL